MKRGAFSSDFQPLREKRQDTKNIAVDLQRFRLTTGAPIFIDFKSIPYKDTEVVEWWDRLQLAQTVQEQIKNGKVSEAVAVLRGRGITHLILQPGPPLLAPDIEETYADDFYRVYRLAPSPK
jgi:hypothetical protein